MKQILILLSIAVIAACSKPSSELAQDDMTRKVKFWVGTERTNGVDKYTLNFNFGKPVVGDVTFRARWKDETTDKEFDKTYTVSSQYNSLSVSTGITISGYRHTDTLVLISCAGYYFSW